ncbi:MAG TPA: hypothetical protein VMJ64_13795, partial [Anaerolineales bacterium]|nr:hypothetical protein [Anaerolineales bacterium]
TEGVYQMAPARDGGWYLERELGTGREYQYCFRAIDGRWFSDATPTPIALDAPVRSSFVIDSEVWV